MKTVQNFTKKGFTLIELMVVIVVIAILATIVLTGLNIAQKNARDTQRIQIMRSVQNALGVYYSNNKAYPGAAIVNWNNALASGLMNAAGANLVSITGPLIDPGCGSGTPNTIDVTIDTASNFTNGAYIAGNTQGCAVGKPTYNYYASGAIPAAANCPANTPYGLGLAKEAGGTTYFCGQQ